MNIQHIKDWYVKLAISGEWKQATIILSIMLIGVILGLVSAGAIK